MKSLYQILLLFLISCSHLRNDSQVIFLSSNPTDEKFFLKNGATLKEDINKAASYLMATTEIDKLTVKIIEPSINKPFLNCARIKSPNQIIAYSPTTLANAEDRLKKKINRSCFAMDYQDLYYTVIHEYIHLLVKAKYKSMFPKWIWEGTSVSQSGELKSNTSKKWAKQSLRKRHNYNFCLDDLTKYDPYNQVGPIFSYYESLHNGFNRELLHLSSQNQLSKKEFMRDKNLPCIISSKVLINYIENL